MLYLSNADQMQRYWDITRWKKLKKQKWRFTNDKMYRECREEKRQMEEHNRIDWENDEKKEMDKKERKEKNIGRGWMKSPVVCLSSSQ